MIPIMGGIGNLLIPIIIMIFHQIIVIIGTIGKVIIGLLMIAMTGGANGMNKNKNIMEIQIGGTMMGGDMKE